MTPPPDTLILSRIEVAKRIALMPDGAAKDDAARMALRLYGDAPQVDKFDQYQFKPSAYITDFLKWTPWHGVDADHPGQAEILEACAVAVRQQIEKRAFNKGEIKAEDLRVWQPGDVIKNWIRVESGNGVGKTKSLSGAVNWFFDCFNSIVYTFHATATQDKLTTWKEIRADRTGKGLPGTILQTQLNRSANRFAISRSPSDAGGKGEESTKGQHNEFLLFVIDEADGTKPFIFDGIKTMLSGGIGVVLMTANPRSRATYFHRLGTSSYSQTLRISTLYHPNVVQNKEVIPNGAVSRQFIEKEIEDGCEVVDKQDEAHFTFDLPYSVQIGEKILPAGTIFKPSRNFMTRILGIAPENATENTLIPTGVFDAACKRTEYSGDPTKARFGVDVNGGGLDDGTLYIKYGGAVWRDAVFEKEDTNDYVRVIKAAALKLAAKGATSLHIRIDGGGGFGNGVIDGLKIDTELIEAFRDFQVLKVHFNGTPHDNEAYKNLITEMMAEAGESLKTLKIIDPPERLETDLCERQYEWRNVKDYEVKELEPKPKFKKRKGHSPDDGDGFVLAVAPDFLFNIVIDFAPIEISKDSIWEMS